MKNVKNKLLINWDIKLISVALAIAFWFMVLNATDYQMTVHIEGIPVEQVNGEVLESLDQVYDVVSGDTVDIVVKGPRSRVSKLSQQDFVAKADLSKMSITNTVLIDVDTKKAPLSEEIDITCKDNTMQLNLEKKISSQFPVIIDTVGTVVDGYALGECIATPNIVTVEGPESAIKKIKEIKAVTSVDEKNSSFDIESEIAMYDAYGERIINDKITMSDETIKGIVNIHPTKSVPVKVEIDDTLSEEYYLSDVIFEPKNITIAGEQNAIDKVTKIVVDDIDVTDLQGNYETTIDISNYLPEGIILGQNSKEVAVTLKIEKIIEKELLFTADDIVLKNAASDKEYEVVLYNDFDIKVFAIESIVNGLNAKDLKAYIDCEKLPIGNNRATIKFEDVNGIVNIEAVGTVRVVVKEKK